jgi:hypothetical protein
MSVQVLSKVGMFPNRTVGAPGTQGAGVLGMQGIGVSTPKAAAVAAATIGLAIDMHIPNGIMFTMGTWSIMLASGTWLVRVLFTGRTTSELGAIPKLHCIMAPIQTCKGIKHLPTRREFIKVSPERQQIRSGSSQLVEPDADALVKPELSYIEVQLIHVYGRCVAGPAMEIDE